MPTKWEVNRAIRGSDLPAPARLILLTLSDVADHGTAEVPEKFTPSLTVLANETGLARSTVVTHLSELERSGWIVRTRPATADALGRGERTRYQLSIPEGSPLAGLVQEEDHPSPGDGLGSPGDGLPLGQEPDQPSPGDGHKNDPHDLPTTKTRSKSEIRPDVEEICEYLVDKIVANGSKRPRISPKWRVEARMLLDADGRTVAQVKNAIDWCQADPFWRAVIMSMPKLRDKYDQLRMAAMRPNGRSPTVEVNGHRLKPETAAHLADQARWLAKDEENARKAIGS